MKEPQPWTVLGSQYVYNKKPYMIMREDHVQMPNGQEIKDYFVLEYPDWVSVLAVTDDGKLVMIRQYRHGIGKVHFELAAGVVDPNEPLLEAAQRELLEETGYGGGEWSYFMAASPNPPTHSNTCHIYLAQNVSKLQNQMLDNTEDIAVWLMDPTEMRQALVEGEVFQALHAAALWRYFAEVHLSDKH